ncbi:MAG TPA: DNA internalization-related competence protein ComEC/Rec2 [Bacilli bacterium]|nr:DNA internalization-related competence protein ComEC/Rec2 [Bacilli bacterium]
MKRPLLLTVVGFLFGAVCSRYWPLSWHPAWMLLPISLFFPLLFLKVPEMMPRQKTALFVAVCVGVGIFYGGVFRLLNQPTLEGLVGQPVTLEARVAEEPVLKKETWRVRLELHKLLVRGSSQEVEEQAIVRVKTQAMPMRYGDVVLLRDVALEPQEPARNPGAFDARSYYGRQGIWYAIALKPSAYRVIRHDDSGLKGRVLIPLRHHLLAALDQVLSHDHSALLAGLVLGDVEEIDEEVMDSFRLLGVVHILAVSGANVALIVLPLLSLLKRFKIPPRKRYAIAILVVLLFAGVTGAGPSVVRACTMSVIWCFGQMIGRDADPLTSLAVAGAGTVLSDPLALEDVGFQLTYGITVGLLLLPPKITPLFTKLPRPFCNLPMPLLNILVISLTAECLSVPLVLTLNPSFTPLSLLANLYLVPILAVLVPLAVITLLLAMLHPVLGQVPAVICGWLLDLLTEPILYSASRNWLVRHYQAPTMLWLCGYYAFWSLVAVGKPTKVYRMLYNSALLVIALALFAGGTYRQVAPAPLRVTFLDVGQGDSTLIETPQHHVWLIDGGGIPAFRRTDYDVGARVVVPALASRGIDTIDVLVMTHADEDHVRGLAAVLQQFEVKQVIVSTTEGEAFYQDLLSRIRAQGTPLYQAQAGREWSPEPDLTFHFFNPPAHLYSHTRSDSNANSVVFSLRYGQRTFLLTGDLEGEAEGRLPHLADVDVLKVAHHGSAHSTTASFLQKITPQLAIISVGAFNSYGHPAEATIERLQKAGASIRRTDLEGAILCETDGRELHVSSWMKGEEDNSSW